MNKNFTLISLIAFFAFLNMLRAQELPTDIDTLNIDKISNIQLQKVVDKAQKKGYSLEQIEQAARLRGLSEIKISKLKSRILELQRSSNGKATGNIDLNVLREEFSDLDLNNFEELIEENEIKETEDGVFGRYIFRNKELNFEPNVNIPTPKDYILGTGDNLIIDIWGGAEKTYQVVVNPEGTIKIPNLVPIYLNGLTIDQASNKISSQLSKIYSGIVGQNKNTFVQTSLSSIRSIKVTLIGEVENPGTYTVSSLSTMFHALYAAGGANKNGNLRNVTLFRQNKKKAVLDIYDFLRFGDRSNDVRLVDHDIIMIMPSSKRVKIKGEIRRPMFYDLEENESLEELIQIAGGFTNDAYPSHVTIQRKSEFERTLITLKDKGFSNFNMKSGDIVDVSSVIENLTNKVVITGAVKRPYYYELTDGMTLTDLINKAEGVNGDAFLLRGQITRLNDDLSYTNISFNLGDVIDGSEPSILLEPEDLVEIKSINNLEQIESISIIGEVRNPSSIPFTKNLSIEDVIFKSGGFTKAASRNQVEIARRIHPDSIKNMFYKAKVFKVEIKGSLETKGESNFVLEPYDQIIVRKSSIYEQQKNVQINGQVINPGYYTIRTETETVSDLINRAGGLTKFAYAPGSQLSRNNINLTLELDKVLKYPKSKFDLQIREGDLITVPRILQTVSVRGEIFRSQFQTRFDEKYKFKKYIALSGGFSMEALKRKSYVLHPNGSADKIKSILFLKKYPEILPGSEIVVPKKPERNKLSIQAWIAIATSSATFALIIQQLSR